MIDAKALDEGVRLLEAAEASDPDSDKDWERLDGWLQDNAAELIASAKEHLDCEGNCDCQDTDTAPGNACPFCGRLVTRG